MPFQKSGLPPGSLAVPTPMFATPQQPECVPVVVPAGGGGGGGQAALGPTVMAATVAREALTPSTTNWALSATVSAAGLAITPAVRVVDAASAIACEMRAMSAVTATEPAVIDRVTSSDVTPAAAAKTDLIDDCTVGVKSAIVPLSEKLLVTRYTAAACGGDGGGGDGVGSGGGFPGAVALVVTMEGATVGGGDGAITGALTRGARGGGAMEVATVGGGGGERVGR